MLTKIQKWGNSQGIRLPREVLRKIDISIGDNVDVSIYHGEIIVKPVKVTRGKYTLKNLLKNIPDDYRPHEIQWGAPAGKEIW